MAVHNRWVEKQTDSVFLNFFLKLFSFFFPFFLYADSLLDPTSQYIHATTDACSMYSTGLDTVTRGLC